jgi:hypothetical protein
MLALQGGGMMRRIIWLFVVLSPVLALLPAAHWSVASNTSSRALAHAEIAKASVKVADIVHVVHLFLT